MRAGSWVMSVSNAIFLHAGAAVAEERAKESVHFGTGQDLKSVTDTLTLANVKPVIDAWAKGARLDRSRRPNKK